MTMTSFGQTAGVSVFVEPVSADLGLARSEISAVYSGATLIAATDWRFAWALAGVSVVLVVIPAAVLLMPSSPAEAHPSGNRSHSEADRWTRRRALRTPIFWLIALTNAAVSLSLTGLAFHQIAILGEAGFGPAAAAANYLPQTVAAVATLGIVAPLASRAPGRWLMAFAMVWLGVGIGAVAGLRGPVMPLVYAVGLGGALGATQALDGTLYPRFFGVRAIASIRGAAFTITIVGAAAGPVFVGVMRELTGGFQAGAFVLLLLPGMVATACLFVREPATQPRTPTRPDLRRHEGSARPDSGRPRR